MSDINIISYPQPPLSEMYQSVNYRFSLVSLGEKGLQQCFPLVKCRDFLTDALVAYATNTKADIYRFTYSKEKNPPIDTSKLRLLLTVPTLKDAAEAKVLSGLDWACAIIHKLEKEFGVRIKTKVHKVKNIENSFLFVGPAIWMKHPVAMSLYTLILRLSAHLPKEDLPDFEELSLEQLIEFVQKSPGFKNDAHSNIFTAKNITNAVKTIKLLGCRTFLSYYKVFEKDLQEKYKKLTGKQCNDRHAIVSRQISNIHECGGFMSLVTEMTYCSKTKEAYTAILKEAV